jgi:hypothetical protein
MPLTQLLWPTQRVSWPVTSPCFLAVCLNFNTCTGKRPRLTGGENVHLFPVVSELGTAIKAHYISSRLRCSFTAALSPFAGLGETDAFVPASEQSVKNRHKLLPPVAVDLSSALIRNLRHIPGALFLVTEPRGPAPSYLLNSAHWPCFVSLLFL